MNSIMTNNNSIKSDKQPYMSNSEKESHETSSHLPRKRTRATPAQLAVLEKTFSMNSSPNNRVREQLSRELGMSERSIQIWFQNRRAKVKNVAKRSSMLHDETLRMQYYASTAATAACQAAVYQQQQANGLEQQVIEDPIKSNPDLYYYYYYYYFNQQQQLQQQQQQQQRYKSHGFHPYSGSSSSVPPPPISLKSMPPPPPPPPINAAAAAATAMAGLHSPTENGSISPSDTMRSDPYSFMWSKKQIHQQRARAHTIGPYPIERPRLFDRGNSVELSTLNKTENFTSLLNTTTTASASTIDTTASISPSQQHQFANISIHEQSQNAVNPFLYQTTPHPLFGQNQPQQLAWSDLPFYEDPSLMITPTTPSMFNTNNVPIYDMTPLSQYHKISAEALQIGTWKRMAFEPSDLLCQYNKEKKTFSWCIRDGLSRFKMDFPQEAIQKMTLKPLQTRPGWASLEIHVAHTHQIAFYMEVNSPQHHWIQCRDYTEDKQASVIGLHQLDGPALALKAELDSLAKEDQYLASIINE
ncbi:uncharacterized protein B0P05DRAFT_489148 [Gilbertella persicaria]|uniref:uncharacterized protein n=1 Tax=Gilbertella persicaria TaxID=101096 RepID=UPI00221F4D51|nr:uncharacterized protein B0P05DRAFT_489148 [Gilbertella persicaria]KAI8083402.1 hypothetical protein B0P05DRAFT_489148 [Gilbertella persicaria]